MSIGLMEKALPSDAPAESAWFDLPFEDEASFSDDAAIRWILAAPEKPPHALPDDF